MPYKHDYDKILTRLVTILSRLNDGEALSITELAREFGTSERTIQRDFNERLISSSPIYQDGKKWKMQDGFRLEKTTSIEDAVVLDIMEGLINGSHGIFATKAKQLLSKIKNEETNPIYAKLDIEDISDKLHEIQQLETAIKNRSIISCRYDYHESAISLRLKPLKIANYQGFWYLIALGTKNEILKKYYLKNISDIVVSDETFVSEPKLDTLLENAISIWFENKNEPFEVRLRIDAQIAKYFIRKPISKTQKIITTHEDGSIEMCIDITHEMEIIPIVKYWLPHIRLIAPENIDEKIKENMRSYLQQARL